MGVKLQGTTECIHCQVLRVLSFQQVILTKGVISATIKMQSLQNVSFLLLYSSIRLCNSASGNRHSDLSKQEKSTTGTKALLMGLSHLGVPVSIISEPDSTQEHSTGKIKPNAASRHLFV